MNPLDEKGIAVEDQFRSWSELNVAPYDKLDVHPYTRTRVILMNGIEVESIMFSHQFARHTDNLGDQAGAGAVAAASTPNSRRSSTV